MTTLAETETEPSASDGRRLPKSPTATTGFKTKTRRSSIFHAVSNLFSPYVGTAAAAFLTDETGKSLLDVAHESHVSGDSTNAHAPPFWSSQTLNRLFRLSASTIDSVVPHFATKTGGEILSLATFCDLIAKCASLERASILSVECWKERSRLGVIHRTLIFHLHRSGRDDVWLRIDRDRSHDVPLPLFTLRGGRSEANDLAQIAGIKTYLLKRGISLLENRMEFASPPSLGVFRFFLQVICEELLEYRIWPENCWFMCSLLEEHLLDTGKGYLTMGKLHHLQLAPQIRARVDSRVRHIVSPPPTMSDIVSLFSKVSSPFASENVQTLIKQHSPPILDASASIEDMERLAEYISKIYAEVTYRSSYPVPQSAILDLSLCAVSLERRIYQQQPASNSARLLKALHKYRLDPLHSALDSSFLTDIHGQQQLFDDDPVQNWYGLACRLVSAARAASCIDPLLARACVDEVRRIVMNHSHGRQLWTDGQKLKGHRDGIISVAISPDGKQIASGSADGTIIRWDASTGARIGAPLTGHTLYVRTVAYAPDSRLIVSSSQDRTIRLWDAITGEPVGQPFIGHTDWIRQAAFSPDGKHIASASDDLTIRRWDVGTGRIVGEPMLGHTEWVWTLAYSSDGERIVSGSKDNTVRVWDAKTGEPVGKSMSGHTHAVTSVVFSPDCRMIVSGAWDNTLRRWDAVSGEMIGQPMEGHTDRVNCVAFAPDARRIVSGSSDQSIRLWDAATGDCIGDPLIGHARQLESVFFTPNGKQVVSGAWDSTVRIWDRFDDVDQWTRFGFQ